MDKYAETYPGYGFEVNAGYGTAKHLEAIRKLGFTPVHRKSFHPGAPDGAIVIQIIFPMATTAAVRAEPRVPELEQVYLSAFEILMSSTSRSETAGARR